MGILKTLLSAGASALGGIYGYVAVFALGAALAGYATGWTVHKVDRAAYEALQLRDAQDRDAAIKAVVAADAVTAAKQHQIDTDATDRAVAETKAQDALHVKIVTVVKEVDHVITQKDDAVACIPSTVVLMLNTAIGNGFSPSTEASTATDPATSQPDGTCSSIEASDFARQIVENVIEPAQANAEQLNALEEAITKELNEANDH